MNILLLESHESVFFFKQASVALLGSTTCSQCPILSFLSGGRRSSWVRSWTVWTYFRDYFPIRVSWTTSFLGPYSCHASIDSSNCWTATEGQACRDGHEGTAMKGQPCRDSYKGTATVLQQRFSHFYLPCPLVRHHNHKLVLAF